MLSMSFDFSETNTSRTGSSNGGGRSTTALITLNIAVLAPIPSASVSTATAVKPGFLSNWRKAYRRLLITDRVQLEFFGVPDSSEPGHIPAFPGTVAIWLKRAHVIESKLFCITCAISQTK